MVTLIPPAFIFARKNFTDTLMKGAPPGSVGWAVPSGWMDNETFLKWLAHFQKHAKATVENKVLLILDNHASHRTLPVVDYARLHGIVMLSLPPHTSHRMQPLDKTFFGPLKKRYNKVCDNWIVTNPGKRITPYDIVGLLGNAYSKCSTVAKATSGFASTGIYPFNPDIFADSDYAPSMVTDNTPELLPSTSQQSVVITDTVPLPSASVVDQVLDEVPAMKPLVRSKRKVACVEAASATLSPEQPTSGESVRLSTRKKSAVTFLNRKPKCAGSQECRCCTATVAARLTASKTAAAEQPARPEIGKSSQLNMFGESGAAAEQTSQPEIGQFSQSSQLERFGESSAVAEQTSHPEIGQSSQSSQLQMSGESSDVAEQTSQPEIAQSSHEVTQIAAKQTSRPEIGECSPLETFPTSACKRRINIDISPLPKAPSGQHGRKRKAQKSEIITSSPFKKVLLEKEEEVKKKALDKLNRIKTRGERTTTKNVKMTQRTLLKSELPAKGKKATKNNKITNKSKVNKSKSKKNQPKTIIQDDYFCLVCGENFEEEWVQCKVCNEWAHEECADLGHSDYYFCDNCKQNTQ